MTREQILARLAELEQLLKLLDTTQRTGPLNIPIYRATEQTGNIHEIRDYSRPADASRPRRRSD